MDEDVKKDRFAGVKKWAYLATFIFAAMSFVQNCYLARENDKINHRLDVKDAYFYNGLKTTAKDLEKGYMALKQKEAKYIEHCKTHNCKLPVDLAVAESEIKYTPIDTILMGGAKEGNK